MTEESQEPTDRRPFDEWSQDPGTLARIRALVPLTQRTSTIEDLLSIDAGGKRLNTMIRNICLEFGLEHKPPRGKRQDPLSERTQSPAGRAGLSLLIAMMQASRPTLRLNQRGQVDSGEIVDAMIVAYTEYRRLAGATGESEAAVRFDNFVGAWAMIVSGETSTQVCFDCGSLHVVAGASGCPFCALLGETRTTKLSEILAREAAEERRPPPLSSFGSDASVG